MCYMQSYSNVDKQKNIKGLIDNFLFSLYSSSENTQKTYTHILLNFQENMRDYNEIKLEHIEQYVIKLKKRCKASTVNVYINAIKSLYNFAELQGCPNIGKLLKTLPSLPTEQRILSQAEYDKICIRCKKDYKLDCFKFMCHTGLRVSEFVTLRPENVANGFLRVIGKGRKNRSIPLNKTAKDIFSKNKNFEMIKHRNRLWIFRICKQLATESEIPEFHPHSCRHYFSNELYHRGVDMFTISRLLGHSSTSVTENVYVHWSEESLAGSTDALEN